MDGKSWWKIGAATVVVLLGLVVADLIVPGTDSDVSATVPAFPGLHDEGPGPQPSSEFAWFAKYDGIDGEATDSAHDKWIEIGSMRRLEKNSEMGFRPK